jgi:Xaa-Pro aminopeptidase
MEKLLIIALLSVFSLNISASDENAKIATLTNYVTPPAPKFTDAERQSELSRRRTEVGKRMSPNSVMILWSAEPRNYAGDVDFMYRQENNLYYLTNLRQSRASLILIKDGDGNVRELLFIPKRNPATETWNGRMYSNEDATRISGVKQINDAAELNAFLESIKNKSVSSFRPEQIYLLLPNNENDGDGNAEFRRESEFSKSLTDFKVVNSRPIFNELRLIKSPMEQKLMQHAIDITTEAQLRAMGTAKNVKWEYETQAEIEYIFRKRNANYWGYPSIVGCGPNATTLHYVESQGAIKPGDLLLMDVGAEYDHYTADVTRTFPINGKFTREQTEIYQIVYDAQEAAAKTIKPGATFGMPQRAAADVIKNGLAKLGLVTAPDATFEAEFNGKTFSRPQYTLFYMHGWGHWLGMNVHDVGDYAAAFKPGMIMTNEPGIYIREDALDYLPDTPVNRAFIAKIKPVFEKYKNIGVRIEDDMLVTETGVEWMSKKLPRTIAEVEAFMAKASNEARFNAVVERNLNSSLAILNGEKYSLLSENQIEAFNFAKSPKGKTVRKGWIWSGKATSTSGLDHASHSHSE